MSNILKEYIRQALLEDAKDTGMTTAQWWQQKGEKYTGSAADDPYFVYIDKSGKEVAGSKGGAGDPYTYKDLGDGRFLVTSGPSNKSIGAIVSQGSKKQTAASDSANVSDTQVKAKTKKDVSQNILEFQRYARIGSATALSFVTEIEEFSVAIGTANQQEQNRIFNEDNTDITEYMSSFSDQLGSALKAIESIEKKKQTNNSMPYKAAHPVVAKYSPEIKRLSDSLHVNLLKSIDFLKKRMQETDALNDEEKEILEATKKDLRVAYDLTRQSSVNWVAGWYRSNDGNVRRTAIAKLSYNIEGRQLQSSELRTLVNSLKQQLGMA